MVVCTIMTTFLLTTIQHLFTGSTSDIIRDEMYEVVVE
jgi:hypothetical protein